MKQLAAAVDAPPTYPERDAALAFLLQRINYEAIPAFPYAQRSLKLDRMRTLLARLGNPDAGLPIVHVAGTKGKGSTAALLGSLLRAAGYRVGTFSSPHLERIEERFCVNGTPCQATQFVEFVERIRPVVEELDREAENSGDPSLRLTFFELNTAIALLHFRSLPVDVVILEVGLGGRLDSTNVCQSIVSIISSISLDHTRQLGTSLEEIAREKGGIIKPGVPVVIGPMEEGPRQEIRHLAKQRGARCLDAACNFRFAYRPPHAVDSRAASGRIDYELLAATLPEHTPAWQLQSASLGLLGAHQAANAAVALTAAAELCRQGWAISESDLRCGLAQASLNGRIEVVRRQPTVVLDVAHNTASASALIECLNESFAASRRQLVLATTRDKDVRGIARIVLPHFERICVTSYQENPRGVPAERLAAVCRQELRRIGGPDRPLTVAPTPRHAWQQVEECDETELVCITGSFFIVAEMRRLVAS